MRTLPNPTHTLGINVIRDIPPLDGPMTDYDEWLQKHAELRLAELKAMPSWKWWRKFIRKPALKVGLFADSYVVRNRDRLAAEILDEFVRVFGREATILDNF